MKFYVEVECKTTGDKISFDFDHPGGVFTAFDRVEQIVLESVWKPDLPKSIFVAVRRTED